MTEQPRTFTAPVAGRYHFVSGEEPHLAEDCPGCINVEPGERVTVELETVPAPDAD